MLGWKVIEGKEDFFIFLEALDTDQNGVGRKQPVDGLEPRSVVRSDLLYGFAKQL
jgi:hypothetical protein